MTTHRLDPTPLTTADVFSRAHPTVLSIDPGDMGDALDAMVGWLQVLFDLDKAAALALASTCVDLRITQVVNQPWGVHAVLPTGVLA